MNQERPGTRLHGRWLAAGRGLWFALVVFTLGVFMMAIPARYDQLQTPTAAGDNDLAVLSFQEAALLQQQGIPVMAYALYFIVIETGFVAVFAFIGLMLFRRRRDEGLALFASLTMVTFGALIPGTMRVLDTPQSILELPIHFIQALGWSTFFTCVWVFPDGQFVPRASRVLPFLFALWGIAWILVPSANAFNWPLPLALLAFAAVFFSGLCSQLYRYLWISTPTQRLQTQWVIAGFAGATLGTILFLGPSIIFPSLAEPGWARIIYHVLGIALFAASLLLIPISINIAIQRYRLWAIDPIVNRALVYSVLTLGLALVYAVVIALLQEPFRVLTGQQQSEIVTVISTLVIAALFNPLRRRIQDSIDRQFYRRKYDAAKTLAAFSATVREQVELDQLTASLLTVVKETMEPTHVSLWLKDPNKGSRIT